MRSKRPTLRQMRRPSTTPAGAPTFRELVTRVRSTVLSAVANAALPFACVLQAAGVPSSPAHAPVFATAVHMPDAGVAAAARDVLHGAGLVAKPVEACWPWPLAYCHSHSTLSIEPVEACWPPEAHWPCCQALSATFCAYKKTCNVSVMLHGGLAGDCI